LLEDNDIGWAWWPMKKIESVAGPLSVEKTTQYQTLLDYWSNGGTAPSAAFAKATLMEITELLKIENCFFQKDVIDAMFRQVNSNETRPFKDHTIPGLVMATNYDMGVIGEAYFDVESANYQVSTGTFTSWNNGWRYRNDGVDIDVCNDNINTNGYAVAWIDDGEWMQYEVEVTSEAVYDINVRVAAGVSGGSFHFMAGDSDISIPFYVSNTGGWQTWITRTVPNVILGPNDNKIKFFANQSGFNVSSFEFVEKGPTTELENIFVSAITVDENTIQLNVNKYLEDNLTSLPANFEIFANGTSLPITNIVSAPNNARILYFTVDHTMNSTETLRISYNGNNINATDGTALTTFIQKDVKNTLFFIHPIPGKVEAEEYFEMSGIQLENTSDNGGGQNIGYLDPEDYIDYKIAVSTSGIYQIDYRTASEISNGSIDLQLVSENGEVNTIVSNHNFSLTGGWQTWSTTSHQVQLPAGIQTLRIKINQAPFNLNWFDLNLLMATNILTQNLTTLKVFPNPSNDIFQLELGLKNALDTKLEIRDFSGQLIYAKDLENTLEIKETISLSDFPNGIYLLSIITNDGELHTEKLVKISQ